MDPKDRHRDCHNRAYGCAMTSFQFEGPTYHRAMYTRGQYRLGY